jgi:hypothetical protein
MSTLQRIGAGFGLLCGIIIAAIGLDLAWDTIATGEIIGALIVLTFVALPGVGTVIGLTAAMARENREWESRTARECMGDWHCWCPDCTTYRTGIDLPD